MGAGGGPAAAKWVFTSSMRSRPLLLAGRPRTSATTGAASVPLAPAPTRPQNLRVPWGLVSEMVAIFRGWPTKVMGAPEPTVTAASKMRVNHSVPLFERM